MAIARGHVFNDANKRTALASALAYLESEGLVLARSSQLEDVMVDVAQGLLDEQELAEMLRALHGTSS